MTNPIYKKQDVMDLATKLGVTIIEADAKQAYAVYATAPEGKIFEAEGADEMCLWHSFTMSCDWNVAWWNLASTPLVDHVGVAWSLTNNN